MVMVVMVMTTKMMILMKGGSNGLWILDDGFFERLWFGVFGFG